LGSPFPNSFVEAVRDAADIVQVVSEYVPLKRAGSRLKGLCPFHQEKTPSFSVDPQNRLFYCFGCQTGGDLFKFVMLYEKLAFPEAVEMLAQRFGVPVPQRTKAESRADDERERLRGMNLAAAEFYRKMLGGDAGVRCRDYLESRGIGNETAQRLGLGYAPDAWESLRQYLNTKRYKTEEVLKGGLALPRKSGQGCYDRFRDRLIFPIRDVRGRTLAFGGRAIGDAEPKYINSPETPTYTKGDQLYGLELAHEAIRREGFAVVVEGYLDLAALVQAGFDQVVATLGTAFTPAQARLLARYTDRVLVSYDGDSAGADATARSLDLLLERGFEVRVVELPAGKDPDDFVRDEGPEAYERLLRQAPAYLEFLIRCQTRDRELKRLEDKVSAVNAVLPHIAKLGNSIERSEWATRLADALHLEDDLVLQELRKVAKTAQKRIRQRPKRTRPLRWNEARLVSLLLRSAEQRKVLAETLDPQDLDETEVAGIVRTILGMGREEQPVDYPAVLSALESETDRDLLATIAFRDEPDEGPGVEDCLCASRRDRLSRLEREAVRQLGEVEKSGSGGSDDRPSDDVDRWLSQVQELAKQRDLLH
jgi:DNA primase